MVDDDILVGIPEIAKPRHKPVLGKGIGGADGNDADLAGPADFLKIERKPFESFFQAVVQGLSFERELQCPVQTNEQGQPSSSSSALTCFETAPAVTFSSVEARVRLKCLAAASKAASALSEGSP